MKKQKLRNCLKLGILIFGISLLMWNCQKEDDNQIVNSDQNKNKSISQTSLDDILNQNSLSKETFGLMSKNQKTSSKNKTNEPTFKLTSSKGLKYVDNGNAYHVFLMKRTDKIDSYYYNLVVHDHNGTLEKYIYKYPLDKSEGVTISKITNDNNINKNSKSTYSKPPVQTPIRTDLGGGCTETYVYDITPCPCVGHLDPAICFCQIQPVWKYVGGPYYYCPAPVTNNPTIEAPDENDNNDPDLIRGTTVFYPIPPDAPTPHDDEPPTPLPTLEPDFEDYSITSTLDLTNLQKDWLEKLENINFKSDIEDFLNQFVFTDQFNDAKSFAQQAVIAWMLNRNIKIDLEESFASPFNVDLELVRPTILNPEPEKVKFMCIYNKLIKSPKFKKLFVETFGESENMHVQFKIVDNIPPIPPSTTEPNGVTKTRALSINPTTGEIVKYNAVIEINKSKMGVSSISLAKTILHESIHAYLTVKQYGCNQGTPLEGYDDVELSELLNMYFSTACPAQSDHEFMFDSLLPTMSGILADIKDDLIPLSHQQNAESETFIDESNPTGPEIPWNWNQFYKYLSMAGLQNSNAFKNNIENTDSKFKNYKEYAINYGISLFSKDCND